jgi:hypothetical protein
VLFIYSAKACLGGRHVFVLASTSGLRGHTRTYLTILGSADHALFKMVRYVLLRPLMPELDAKTKTCLPAKTRFCHLDEQAIKLVEGGTKTDLTVWFFGIYMLWGQLRFFCTQNFGLTSPSACCDSTGPDVGCQQQPKNK